MDPGIMSMYLSRIPQDLYNERAAQDYKNTLVATCWNMFNFYMTIEGLIEQLEECEWTKSGAHETMTFNLDTGRLASGGSFDREKYNKMFENINNIDNLHLDRYMDWTVPQEDAYCLIDTKFVKPLDF